MKFRNVGLGRLGLFRRPTPKHIEKANYVPFHLHHLYRFLHLHFPTTTNFQYYHFEHDIAIGAAAVGVDHSDYCNDELVSNFWGATILTNLH
jgi:hypothetical protein